MALASLRRPTGHNPLPAIVRQVRELCGSGQLTPSDAGAFVHALRRRRRGAYTGLNTRHTGVLVSLTKPVGSSVPVCWLMRNDTMLFPV